MIGFLRHMMTQWSAWLGDRDLEQALRAHLSRKGYQGEAALLRDLKLVAIQRPGWLQVYSFSVQARATGDATKTQQQLFGVVRQDERYAKMDIELFGKSAERNVQIDSWSQELVRLRGVRR